MAPPQTALLAVVLSCVSCLCRANANEVANNTAASPLVRITDGLLAGRREILSGHEVDSFLGIPYAMPPMGDLRFEKPQPPKPWNGTYDATKKSSPCMQLDFPFIVDSKIDNSHASEDCLYINVWRPASVCGASERCKPELPVFVFIHGGGFQWGDSMLFVHDLSNFVSLSNVIAVGFNYRVSIFGFLTAGRKEFPGNWGLWDQHMALQWVQKNIASFGGNPAEVTLGGQSAGAISAALHSIVPRGHDLFKRIFLQSGSTMSMIVGEPYKGSGKFIAVAGAAGCYDGTRSLDEQLKESVACLKKADAREIYDWLAKERIQNQIFPPVKDDDYIPFDPLLANAADKISAKEVFLGTVANEGSVFAYNIAKLADNSGGAFSLTGDYRLIMTLGVSTLFNLPISTARGIVKHYFGDYSAEHTREEVLALFSDIISDGGFYCPVVFFADKASSQGIKTYRYVYAHRSSFNVWPDWVGVFHAEDLFITMGALPFLKEEKKHRPQLWRVLKDELNMTHYTREEEDFMKELVTTISTYIKTGKPIVPESSTDWPLYSKNKQQYMYLRPHNYTAGTEKRNNFCDLWRPILLKRPDKTASGEKEQTTPSRKASVANISPSSTNEVGSNYISQANVACSSWLPIVLAAVTFATIRAHFVQAM